MRAEVGPCNRTAVRLQESALAERFWWLVATSRLTIPLLIFAMAIALRLPYLMEAPGFTDEGIDVKVGLAALHGQWPLVDAEPYIGSLFNYLIAGGFLVLGHNPVVPRLVVTVLGALTVVLSYFLAKRLAGTTAALITTGLMATSAVHIWNGHIAWSNCTTPFFTTATMLVLVEARIRRSGPLLVAAGALYGLALQTHFSVTFLAPALLVYVSPLLRRSSLLRTPWPYLAIIAAILAYGNVIAYNVLNPGAFETAAREKEYGYVVGPTLDSYLINLQALAAAVVRMVSSSFGGGPSVIDQASLLINLPYVALLLIGIVYGIWRRQLLPLMAIGVTVLMMPYLNKEYGFPFGVRYLGYLLPLLYLLMALPLARILDILGQRARTAALALWPLCLLLVAVPAVNLFIYNEFYLALGATSPTILTIESEIRVRYQAGVIHEVLLDEQLDWVYTAPGGRALRAFDALFDVDQVPHRTVWMRPDNLRKELSGARRPLVLILSDASRQRVGEGFGLVRMDAPNRRYVGRGGYWAYYLP